MNLIPKFLRKRPGFGLFSRRLREGSAEEFVRDGGGYQGRRLGRSANDPADMPEQRREKARQLSLKLFQESPVYGAIVDRFMDHVIGDGIVIEVENPKAQEWLDEQFALPENRFHETLRQRLVRLAVEGEYLLCVSIPPRSPKGDPSGNFMLGRLDVDGITKLGVSAFNNDAVRKLAYRPVGTMMDPFELPLAEPEAELLPLTAGGEPAVFGGDVETIDAGTRLCAVAFWRSNTLGKRSAPLFARALDKSEALDDLMENLLRKAEYVNRFWLLAKVGFNPETANDGQKKFLEELRKAAESADPGEFLALHKDCSLEAFSPELGSVDAKALYDIVIDMILGGYGIPRMWYSSGGDTNRATAAEQGSPIYRAIKSWQQSVAKVHLEDLVGFLLEMGKRAGVAGCEKGAELDYSVTMSDIANRDSLRDADEVARVVVGLNEAFNAGAISGEERQAMIRATLAGKSFGEHLDDTPPDLDEEDPDAVDLDDPRFEGAEPPEGDTPPTPDPAAPTARQPVEVGSAA